MVPKLFLRTIEYYYPWSFLGTLCFGVALYLAGYALSSSNLYALLIAVPLLFFMLAQLLFIRLWLLRQGEAELIWDGTQQLTAQTPTSELRLQLSAANPPYFFRYHFAITAQLKCSRRSRFYYREEAASSANGNIRLPLYFPLCGTLNLKSKLLIRDILGFTRIRLAVSQERNFVVRPPLLEGLNIAPHYSSKRLENNQNRFQADEEKFYMREYVAGDRLKDINWKSSLRLGEMITRYASQSPKEQKLVHIEFRNVNAQKNDSLLALMHLNALKSWLLTFLTQMHRNNADHQFLVESAQTSNLLHDAQDVSNFADILAPIEYVSTQQWLASQTQAQKSNAKIIFTTSFAANLASRSGIDAAGQDGASYIFQIVTAHRKDKKARRQSLLPLAYTSLPWPNLHVFQSLLQPQQFLMQGTLQRLTKLTQKQASANAKRQELALRFAMF